MSKITNITDSKEIDLLRHGVIEAHAGTGKTFTIVRMVLRILEEPGPEGKPVHLREVLLVTFTEKAAGELQKRIREGLEDRIQKLLNDKAGGNEKIIEHLEGCLNNMHEAFIGTIHGVCLRLLRTWPFETGVQFRTELTDDTEGLEQELRTSMRTDWQDPGSGIPWALERLQEEGVRLRKKELDWVADLAGELLDKENTELDRRACFNGIADVKNAEDECCSISKPLKKTLQQLIATAQGILKNPVGLDDKRKEFVSSLVKDWESGINQPVLSPELVLRAVWVKTRSSFKVNADLVAVTITNSTIVKKNPPVKAFADDCRAFASDKKWASILELPNVKGKLLLTMLCDSAERLRDRWNRAKRERGLVSFQDMLRLMHRAVTGENGFVDSLRGRLRYGIIDEFQDTSILQWKIFDRIFLDGAQSGGPRLFIVGDPKQAIYGFQGADVKSYLEAKKAIGQNGGRVYGLVSNYRSLPELIDGYNVVLGREQDGPDWFGFDGAAPGDEKIAYPDSARGGVLAHAPKGKECPPVAPLREKPVQIMVLEGSAGRRRWTMARWTSFVIRSLVGRSAAVRDKDTWTERPLDYRDFAVIVESHSTAGPFLERFQEDGIPAVKYKMGGVFQSPMARDLHAVLRAVLHSEGGPAPRLAALLTYFFNRRPADIDPEKDLELCRRGAECRGDRLCIAHALEKWTGLAERRRWPQLFSSIEQLTGIRERLIRLADGERHLADLRQVGDYCVENLCRDNLTLQQLVEHLGRLLNGEESADQDRNLYTLATDRSSVRVMTMHAAKGLEFPVVFAVPGSSEKPKKRIVKEAWIGSDHKRHVLPAISGQKIDDLFENEKVSVTSWVKGENGIDSITEEKTRPSLQATQERRRLLYVALTRAQVMLFVPAQVKEKAADWLSCSLPSYPDRDLTPRLLHLLAEKKLPEFDAGFWENEAAKGRCVPATDDSLDPAWTLPPEARTAADEIQQRIVRLDLPGTVCRQTSYTELSSRAATDRSLDRSGDEPPEKAVGQKSVLPGGRGTGDALHVALEELLSADREKAGRIIAGNDSMKEHVRKYLVRNGVLNNMDKKTSENAVDKAAGYVKSALTKELKLPDRGTVIIADLDRKDRMAEMEFTLGVKRHWVKGFMDLVFRVKNASAKHPWRYYVLDWKSDTLEQYTADMVRDHVRRHYEIQEKLYGHALDKYLQGLLGGAYDPKENLGGSVYVFLRGLEGAGCPVWTRIAEPEKDARFTEEQIKALVLQRAPAE